MLQFKWSYFREELLWDKACGLCDSLTEKRDEPAKSQSERPNKSCSFSR